MLFFILSQLNCNTNHNIIKILIYDIYYIKIYIVDIIMVAYELNVNTIYNQGDTEWI